jgi:sortase (surface protein transpeptidase)
MRPLVLLMKKTLFLLVVFVLLAAGLYLFKFRNSNSETQAGKPDVIAQDLGETKQIGLPTKLSIPSLGVETDVEHVGLDAKRNMDVPKDAANVAWYNLGPRPGESGSAVMAGHLDSPDGSPAVFWELKNIEIGEKIEVTDENGETYTYEVERVESYDFDKFPLEEVFADRSGKKLNLITCEGTFDRETKNYSKRTVAYAVLKE